MNFIHKNLFREIMMKINLERLKLNKSIKSFQIIKKEMNYSKQKHPHPESYYDYLVEADYFKTNQCEPLINLYKTHTHKRKLSQISPLSYKSKRRNVSSFDQINHSLTKLPPHIATSTRNRTLKSTKTEKRSLLKKQFSSPERIKISHKNKNILTNRKQKLKINTDRKDKTKNTESLTSRCINSEKTRASFKNVIKTDKHSHSNLADKCQNTDEDANIDRKRRESQKRIICDLKMRQKNLKLIVSRCSKVMTEYYERITLLKKQNQFLKVENMEIKNYQLFRTKDKSVE